MPMFYVCARAQSGAYKLVDKQCCARLEKASAYSVLRHVTTIRYTVMLTANMIVGLQFIHKVYVYLLSLH